jgi:transcriptional regulator with XRE-family HTH domain
LCSSHYNTRRERDIAYGRWQPGFVQAAAVRRHVESLRGAGLGMRRIATLSGVDRSVLQSLMVGRKERGWGPSSRISLANATKLLSVSMETGRLQVAGGTLIDITGTTRRLRALVAIGYSQTDLCARLGITDANGTQLFTGKRDRVRATTACRVAEVYDELSMTPGPSEAARNRAHRKGWMPPLAWDDDEIDSPDAQPNPGHEEKLGFVEKFTEMRELDYSDLVIAQRWKIQPASLLRQLNRHDIKPDAELVHVSTSAKHRSAVERAS